MPTIPRSVLLALGWRRIAAGSRAAVRQLQRDDEPHHVGAAPLPLAIAELGAHAVWTVLPAAGDPQGVGRAASAAAIGAEEAVVAQVSGGVVVLVPEVIGFGSHLEPGWHVRWRAHDGAGSLAPSTSVGEARLALLEVMREAIDELTRLDVAKERPELREAFLDLAGPPSDDVAEIVRDLDDRAAEVLVRALRLLDIAALAREDHGAAISAGQIAARGDVLTHLERVARGAVAAATLHPVG